MGFKKPRPRPKKVAPALETMTDKERERLSKAAEYVGSPHHTDIPKFGLQSDPRTGAKTIERVEAEGLKNPSCTVCPRKWARRQEAVIALLQAAIEAGNFIAEPADAMPARVWARDPEDSTLVYEAKLARPPNGYKAYPLTRFQALYGIPFRLP